MQGRFTTDRDPALWCAGIALSYLALVWWRLGIPSEIYFDEVHYVPAARKLLEGARVNAEHPMLGKTVLAAALHWLGDTPLAWRIPSAVGGTIGLFAFTRMVWFASGNARATVLAALLLATDFFWFIHSRIAMLDMTMAALAMLAAWQIAAALRLPGQARWRLALGGVLMGLALGAKWSVAPLLVLPGLAFLVCKLKDNGRHFLLARGGGPVPGISLVEAALWLGVAPLAIYWLTFWPAFHWAARPVDPWAPIAWHEHMLKLQDSVKKPHPYRSEWYQWISNWRAIWYLYQEVDGVQRGVVLIGNPYTMLAGLIALGWAVWAGIRQHRTYLLALAALYLASVLFWALSGKPVQFLYHYLLASTFLMALLALALDAVWRRTDHWRWLGPGSLALSGALFLFFFPIIAAAPLCCGKPSYQNWMWLKSWR